MRPFLLRGLGSAVAAIVLAIGQAAPAAAEVRFNARFPFTFVAGDACTGSPVLVSGTAHILSILTTDESGGFHTNINGNLAEGSAVSPAGATYKASGWFHDLESSTSSGATVFTGTSTLQLKNTVTKEVSIFSGTFVLTIDANGTPTATVSNAVAKCAGKP